MARLTSKLVSTLVCVFACGVVVCAETRFEGPSVSKVEPPSWWAGHTINPVRLLVRGKNLTGARVRATEPAIQTSSTFVNRNGTYLFVNVNITPTARPGSYPLIIETAQGNTTIPFTIESSL